MLGSEEGDQELMPRLINSTHEHAKAIHASYLVQDQQTPFDE
jgi:hypothetical protein